MAFLFSVSLFVSAALLFSVQPMIGKMILPKLGGTPAVWNTCMVFFQAALLLGYAYAHFLTRWLDTKRQALIHSGLILLPLTVLPIRLSDKAVASIPVDNNPVHWLIGTLIIVSGLPFIIVSTTAPLLQKWFSSTRHRHAHDPYFLYSASNMGSMLGLLSYPAIIEPRLSLIQQSRVWAIGYGCLAILVICCAAVLWRSKSVAAMAGDCSMPCRQTGVFNFGSDIYHGPNDSNRSLRLNDRDTVTCGRLMRWVMLAFVPSSLMLGVTTYLTTDIAPFPLLWVVPLALYLLTFILVFARRPVLPPLWLGRVLSLCSVVLLVAFIVGANHPAWLMTLLNLLFFAAASMIFHGALAKDRPAASRLTEFYLCMSVGGVLGGLFNAMIAPLLFKNVLEYPLVMLAACLFRPAGDRSDDGHIKTTDRWRDAAWATGIGMLTAGLILAVQALGVVPGRLSTLSIFGIPALLTYRFVKNPVRFGLCLAAVLAASLLYKGVYGRTLLVERNFFGVLRVTIDAEGKYHQLFHGNTLHGLQSIDPARQRESLSYFSRTGPIGQVFEIFNSASSPTSVGVIGLGAGSLAAYAKPTQDWTFYEIDPAVERISSNPVYFTFLKNSQARKLSIVLGDARLRLKDAPNSEYGLLVLDAFSSDAIPMHLVTREALQLYLQKLAHGGILAFHITNRRLDLKPVFANLAYDAGLIALIREDSHLTNSDKINGKIESVWVIMARHKDDLGSFFSDPRWEPLHPDSRTGIWSDDFSNILSVISWKN